MSNETIYTFDSDDIYFLNDKNIVSAINENARINGIPSQVLFKLIYNELSSADKALSDIISAEMYGKLSVEFIEFKDTVETSCDNISTLIGSVSTDLSNTITTNSKHIDELLLSTELISGEVNRLCSEVSTDVEAKYSKLTSDDSFISAETGRLYAELSDNVENKFVHKEGDNVRWLSVANGLSATTLKVSTTGKEIATEQFTTVLIDKDGIRADAIGDGKEIALSTNNSTNGIMINGTSLSSHIKNEVRISADETLKLAKTYTDSEIQKLKFDDTVESKQFVTAVSETDGKITVQKAELVSSDIPTIEEALVKNLTTDLQNLSTNYVAYTDFTTKNIDNDGKFLSAEDFTFRYDDNAHIIWLSAGNRGLSVDSTDFIKNRIVHHTRIIELDGKKLLRLYWTEDETQFVDISITDLVQVYKFNDGLLTSYVDNKWQVDVDDSIARTADVNVINENVDIISTDVISLKAYADKLSTDNGIIAKLSTDISSAIDSNIRTVKQINKHITIDGNEEYESLSSLFYDQKIYDRDLGVKNGTIVDVTFTNNLSGQIVVDSLSICNSEYLLVWDDNKIPYIRLENLNTSNVKLLKSGVSQHEFALEIQDRIANDYYISSEVNRLCSEISTDVEAKYSKLTVDDSFISGEVNRLCSEISNDIETKYSKLTTDNSFISAETDRLCSEVSADVEAKYSELTSDDSFISGEVNRLCSEVSTDVEAKYSWLSNNIVTVSNDNTCYHQLSVIKIAKDEYDTLVADKPEMLSGNTLYIVDSDYMDAYGQVLCNLVMTNDSVPSDAANKHYVDEKDNALATDIKSVSSSVEVIKSKFNADTIATDPVLTKLLDDKNDSDISTVISAVMYIFNTLTQV